MKNYLIVGASSGIGKSIAEQLAKENQIFGTYRNTAVDIAQNIHYHYLDVMSDEKDLSFLPDTLDGLVYCPGTINLKPFKRFSADDFVDDFKLQVSGAVDIIQQCLPQLQKSKQSSIILFSSVAAQTGFNFHTQVSASKGAIEGFAKALAAELAPGVRVNVIAPSLTHTPLASALLNTEKKIEANADRHPLKSIGQSEDIAHLACFLLSDKAKWITGQIHHIDGGISTLR
ncbi:NAD(P)-dependent dehydrogenase, short-chain alcohol dehydrogenase family [Lishizhenia tianjinensis]|uniref:NAD(P)-dependent dehydrogenase, short-chain alcohol dehydrogenase family n=1 Tax=Lishizhenia tianjinensis TaxID=477690 RepID=A0A1I6XEN6_9FLAO|nr:SDR family oxidoreductase [Lishizhenia tianjinensis]SFT36637.1 NAD(P)-dependent dehydrogenase, short-chain alcohol dehydrogenase family [Lishizhenia tianjinensis]